MTKPFRLTPTLLAFALAAAGVVCFCGAAKAQLSLTAAGTSAGFTLSTFATGFPNTSSLGPLGIAFPTTGGVMVTDWPGNVRTFTTDTDGQSAASFSPTAIYSSGNAVGLATVGSAIYMTQQSNGAVVQVNSNGTFNQSIVSIGSATGIEANPNNGHLFVTGTSGSCAGSGLTAILDVNPITKTFTVFKCGNLFDGLTTNGTTLYVESGGHILGFNIATTSQVYDSGALSGGPDGAAVGSGSLAGNIFVNTNDGHVIEVNLTTNVATTIAQSGSRGDFVKVDPNGSLLLTQTDRIMRLTAPAGGGFGTVPEPGSIAMFSGAGISGLFVIIRKRKR
jgi:hypothetical protein